MITLTIFYLLGLLAFAALLIKIIEKQMRFDMILLMHALLIVIVVAAGLDAFMMFFAVIDVMVVFLLHQRSENS